VEEGHVLQQRDPDFRESFLHLEGRRIEFRNRIVEGDAGGNERVFLEVVGLPPILGADREADRAAGQLEQLAEIAVDEAREVELGNLADRSRRLEDIVPRRLADVAGPEQVDRNAGRDVRGKGGIGERDVVAARRVGAGRGRIELRAALDLAGRRIAGGVEGRRKRWMLTLPLSRVSSLNSP